MKIRYLVPLILIVFGTFMTSCFKTEKTIRTKEPTMDPLYPVQTPLPVSEIEILARLKIPDSASDIQTHALYWMDDIIFIRFQLPAYELNDFLASAGFSNLKPGYWPFYDERVPWWPKRNEFIGNPARIFAGEKIDLLDQGFSKSIGVDMTNEDIYTIYLKCFDV